MPFSLNFMTQCLQYFLSFHLAGFFSGWNIMVEIFITSSNYAHLSPYYLSDFSFPFLPVTRNFHKCCTLFPRCDYFLPCCIIPSVNSLFFLSLNHLTPSWHFPCLLPAFAISIVGSGLHITAPGRGLSCRVSELVRSSSWLRRLAYFKHYFFLALTHARAGPRTRKHTYTRTHTQPHTTYTYIHIQTCMHANIPRCVHVMWRDHIIC